MRAGDFRRMRELEGLKQANAPDRIVVDEKVAGAFHEPQTSPLRDGSPCSLGVNVLIALSNEQKSGRRCVVETGAKLRIGGVEIGPSCLRKRSRRDPRLLRSRMRLFVGQIGKERSNPRGGADELHISPSERRQQGQTLHARWGGGHDTLGR